MPKRKRPTRTMRTLKAEWNEPTNGFPFELIIDRDKPYSWTHKSKQCDCIHETLCSFNEYESTTCLHCHKFSTQRPCCEARSILGDPKLATLWNWDTNPENPRDLPINSDVEHVYHWRCSKTCKDQVDCKHEWDRALDSQKKTGCPHCNTRGGVVLIPCCKSKSVEGNAELMKFWDHPTNESNNIFPRNLFCNSSVPVSWFCPVQCDPNCFHRWVSAVSGCAKACTFCIVGKGHGPRRVCCRLRSAAMDERLVSSFDHNHPENEGIDLEKLCSQSTVNVWWKCDNTCIGHPECKHGWQTEVYNRTKGYNCPDCSNRAEKPCCIMRSSGHPQFAHVMAHFDYPGNAPLTPLDFYPHCGKDVKWICQFCTHPFVRTMHARMQTPSLECPHCVYAHLCGDINCQLCLVKSVAGWTDPVKKQAFILGNNNVDMHTISLGNASATFLFYCQACKHMVKQHVKSVVQRTNWCSICSGIYTCGEDSCLTCPQKCEIQTTCANQLYLRVASSTIIVNGAEVWTCRCCKEDYQSRSPNAPLLLRTANSLETLTLQQLCKTALAYDRTNNSCLAAVWSNPSAWDCAILPDLPYKPDNIWCFDANNGIFTTVGPCKINLNQVVYAMIFEIIEAGMVQHSQERKVPDSTRELEIRSKLTAMGIPLAVVYLVVAHNHHHILVDPKDIFCFKKNNAYDIIPKRSEDWQRLLTRVLGTFQRCLETRSTETFVIESD